MALSNPDALEKIFEKLEAESERRAALEQQEQLAHDPAAAAANRAAARQRRRTSVSISRFGQAASSDPQTPAVAQAQAPPTPVYSSVHPTASASSDSLDSLNSDSELHAFAQQESDHVTQVQRIAARASIGRSVGNVLGRTLSRNRTRSKPQLIVNDMDVVIGVVVEEAATIETEDADPNVRPESRAMVYASTAPPAERELRTQPSRFTIGARVSPPREEGGLVARAKELTRKLRRRSQSVTFA
ncbi:hypothetical protein PENSPDRAFT_688761 [Peniophora sp. CONT]|nr:hypothetical protein PENSPDRAFT_688761 [Peniophora sp. CONT]